MQLWGCQTRNLQSRWADGSPRESQGCNPETSNRLEAGSSFLGDLGLFPQGVQPTGRGPSTGSSASIQKAPSQQHLDCA